MHRRIPTRLLAFLTVLCLTAAWIAPAVAQDLGSKVNGLVVMDFSDHYITPRGLNVEDKGVVVEPLVLLFWDVYKPSNPSSKLKDLSLTTGVWNSFHSHPSGYRPTKWNEIDPILGITAKFSGGWTVDATTTSFYTPTDSYPTSSHLELKVTNNDRLFENFSINPFASYWIELNNKATVAFVPAKADESKYFTVGATPTFKLGTSGAKLEVATYANFVGDKFYQKFDGSGGGSGFAVFSAYPKVSVPLKFMGTSFGAWTGYAGVNYFHLRNEGLLDGNQVLASPDRNTNLGRVRVGVSLFF